MSATTPPPSPPSASGGGSAHADDDARRQCTATTRRGGRCRKPSLPGGNTCAFHSADPADRAALHEMARRGGRARAAQAARAAQTAAPAMVAPVADVLDIDTLDLTRPADVLALLAGALRQLAHLPFTVAVGHGLAQVGAVVLRGAELVDIDERLHRLEEEAAATMPAGPGLIR